MSLGTRPEKFQMMLTTGMLIFGKMSVGVRKIASVPMIRMRMAITTIVYGRRNASRTIHIGSLPKQLALPAWGSTPGLTAVNYW